MRFYYSIIYLLFSSDIPDVFHLFKAVSTCPDFRILHRPFGDMAEALVQDAGAVDGVLMDLGVSNNQARAEVQKSTRH